MPATSPERVHPPTWHGRIGLNGMGEGCDVHEFEGAEEGVLRMEAIWGGA
jgi:hypothetical protein